MNSKFDAIVETYNKFLLNELFIKGNVIKNRVSLLISYKSNVWILPEIEKDIIEDFLDILPLKPELIEMVNDSSSVVEVYKILQMSNNPDIFLASIKDDILIVEYAPFNNLKDLKNSTQVRKIINQLNISTIKMIDDGKEIESIESDDLELLKYIPSIMYHGTCSKYIKNIFKLGITPSTGGNYKIEHNKPLVFLTTNTNKAYIHARRCAENTNTNPIVLEIEIPDKSYITYDYDVSSYSDDIENLYNIESDEISYRNSYQLSKEMGIYAYKKRIYPTNIKYINIKNDTNYDKYSYSEFDEILRKNYEK